MAVEVVEGAAEVEQVEETTEARVAEVEMAEAARAEAARAAVGRAATVATTRGAGHAASAHSLQWSRMHVDCAPRLV